MSEEIDAGDGGIQFFQQYQQELEMLELEMKESLAGTMRASDAETGARSTHGHRIQAGHAPEVKT